MPPRMIPVRHRETGQETRVGESAYPYFAGAYERLDQPADKPPTPDKSASKRPATTTSKENNDGR